MTANAGSLGELGMTWQVLANRGIDWFDPIRLAQN